jgi:hypothetical protein
MSFSTLARLARKATIGVFKTAGIYTRAADPGNPISLDGVYDERHQVLDPQTSVPVGGYQPTYGIDLGDLPGAPEAGDTVTVAGIVREVLDVQEDGQGGALLILGRRRD